MKEAKRRKLEAKGWHFGNAREFLSLSAEETEFIELKLKLAQSLRALRLKKGLVQVRVAKIVHSSQSRVAKMEAGDASVSLDLLVKSQLALGISGSQLGRILIRPLTKAR